MASNGERMQNTAIATPVSIDMNMTRRIKTRRLKRCTKGTVRGRMYEQVAPTMVAMMNSEGASSPTRPVYEDRKRGSAAIQ